MIFHSSRLFFKRPSGRWLICMLLLVLNFISVTWQQARAPGSSTVMSKHDLDLLNEQIFYEVIRSFHLGPAPVKPVRYANGELNVCQYVMTPRNNSYRYDCEAGYFCPFSSKKFKCTDGFYCGPNCAQPNLCCEGYYCPTPDKILRCPEGSFCGPGSTSPISCSILAYCPEGTSSPKRVGVLFMALAVILLYYFAYLINQSVRSLRRANHFKRMMSVKAKRLTKFAGTLPRYSASAAAQATFDIQFHDLGLVLKNGVCILRGVSGELRAGRTCAIMGPSGSGKSTFMNLLTGSLRRTSGSVYINRERCELAHYRKLIGFVPQDDIMLRELTVLDVLMHSAQTRLPAHWTQEEKKKKVFETIDYLGLYPVMSNPIGTEVKKGLSGGQRKRVNIGMEVVAEPAVLFLDEPASGLDSSTSLEVYTLLQEIALEQNITIAAVIHSPAPDAFEIFDDLLLLGKGGGVAYFGERALALSYFKHLGFTCPKNKTESDFLLDIVSDKAYNPNRPDLTVNKLFKCWDRFQKGMPVNPAMSIDGASAMKSGGSSSSSSSSSSSGSSINSSRVCFSNLDVEEASSSQSSLRSRKGTLGLKPYLKNKLKSLSEYVLDVYGEFTQFVQQTIFCIKDPVLQTPNGFRLWLLCFYRACLQIYRRPMRFLIDQLLYLGCGLFISMASESLDYLGAQPEIICDMTPVAMRPFCDAPVDSLRHVGMFISLGVYFAGISVAVDTFGAERVVYWRESRAGQPTLPYFLGKALADIPRVLCAALMYTFALIIFWPFRSSLVVIYVVIALLFYSAFGIGYFLSVVCDRGQIQLVATASALAWAMVFSGLVPSLESVKESGVYDGISWLWAMSAPRYAVEAIYILEVQARPFVENQKDALRYTYDRTHLVPNIFIIFAIGLIWNTMALLAMKLFNRSKMH